jgi:hypothetical protein
MNMSEKKSGIIYTLTDEAPLLATCAFLPIIRTFAGPAGVEVETCDISVATRILAEFPDYLSDKQKVPNTLADLGRRTLLPETNIIKLPNISASPAAIDGRRSRNCRRTASMCPISPRTRKPKWKKISRRAIPGAWAARSIRCCAKATPTAAHRRPSRAMCASTRTRWPSGAWLRARTWRT